MNVSQKNNYIWAKIHLVSSLKSKKMTFKLERHSDLIYIWYKFMLILTDEKNPIKIFQYLMP